MRIGGREIGAGQPVFVVAELSGNHMHDWQRVVRLVEAAYEAGADAVKGQCFSPERMTLDVDDAAHRIVWQGQERTLYDLYSETVMPYDWHQRIKLMCDDLDIEYFASEFSPQDVDYMESIGAPCHKVASFELTDLPLIRHMAATGKPVILSTGMATVNEIRLVLRELYWDTSQLVLLKCTSSYPAPLDEAHISTMDELHFWPGEPLVGLSDHTRNNSVVSAAVALEACVVERHLTLSRADGGPDAAFSDEPDEFAAMVRVVRDTSAALGTVHYGPTESERKNLRLRRSLWVTQDIAAGEPFTARNVASLRPAGGLPPAQLPQVLGTLAQRSYKRGEPLLSINGKV